MRVASTNSVPSYLFKKLNSRGKIRSFGLRIRVPKILNHQKGELRLSLRTSDRRLTEERAQLITCQLKRIWSNIQEGGPLSHLSESEIDELIKNHIEMLLADNLELMLTQGPLKDETDIERTASFYQDLSDQAHDQYVRRDISPQGSLVGQPLPVGQAPFVRDDWEVDGMLTHANIQIDHDSPDYKMICLKMLQGLSGLFHELEDRTRNGLNGVNTSQKPQSAKHFPKAKEPVPASASTVPAQSQPKGSTSASPSFGSTIKLYWEERSDRWKDRTTRDYIMLRDAFRFGFNY